MGRDGGRCWKRRRVVRGRRREFSGSCMLAAELYTPYLAVESIAQSIDAGQTPARRWVEARGVR